MRKMGKQLSLSHILPIFFVTVSNDNTSITRKAWSWTAWAAGRFLSSLESMGGCEGVCRAEIGPEVPGTESLAPSCLPSGGHRSSLWEEWHLTFLLVACLSEPHGDKVRTVSLP